MDETLSEIVENITKMYGIHEQTLHSIELLKEKNERLSDRVDALSRRVRDLEFESQASRNV